MSMENVKSHVVIFGATGSIGTQTLNVIRRYKQHFHIDGITCHNNIDRLANIAHEFNIKNVGISDSNAFKDKKHLFPGDTRFFLGHDGLCEMAQFTDAHAIVMAITGTDGIIPTLYGIHRKKDVLLASKEILVVAGKYIMSEARKYNCKLLPIDSEHNAIFQCLIGNQRLVKKIILTASGGPFLNIPIQKMSDITPEQALKHPTWNMGKKISIDSATMANKGLEIIEARWLFDMQPDQISVVIHPESIIHSMVEFSDNTIMAQMSPTNMEYPIAYCLFYPKTYSDNRTGLDFDAMRNLSFKEPNETKFPCLKLARQCLNAGGNSCSVFQAANEVAVESFLKKQIKFTYIPHIIEKTLSNYSGEKNTSLEDAISTVETARVIAKNILCKL